MYAIYGIGLEAECFMYQHPNIQIDICVDKYREDNLFHGIQVYHNMKILKNSNFFYIVAVKEWKTYCEIKEELTDNGLKEFDDFIWSRQFNKRIVLINANCHGVALWKYLKTQTNFEDNYEVYPIPEVHINSTIDEELLMRADVFIHQDIRPDNQSGYFVSDEYTVSKIRDDCINITIPNFVGMGGWMYPNTNGENLRKIRRVDGIETEVIFRDEALDSAYNKGYVSLYDIMSYWNGYEVDNLGERQEKDFNKIKERQENWDISIADFIFNNYTKIPCFVDQGHPSRYLMFEIGKKVAKRLNLVFEERGHYDLKLGLPLPLLPSVNDYYLFSFEVEREVRDEYFGKRVKNELEDYIRAYMWWYYNLRI